MKLPNFFIVGSAKSGTTSIYNYMKQHPEIFMSPIKETHHFSTDIDNTKFRPDYAANLNLNIDAWLDGDQKKEIFHAFVKDWNKYKKLFKQAENQKAVGEVTNSYLYSSTAAKNIHDKFPEGKIIMILRNPVERAFSHFLMDMKSGRESGSFINALKRDMAKPMKGWGISNVYFEIGLYYEQVKRYLEVFPKEQVKIILYDDYRKDAPTVLKEICEFLTIDSGFAFEFSKEHNKAMLPKSAAVTLMMKQKGLKNFVKDFFPKSLKKSLKKIFFTEKNLPKLSTDDRKYLVELYKDDIQDLSKLINRDLSAWIKT